jgi:hypothetical protein
MAEHEQVGRQDVEALLETRRELGPSYDEALVDSFAERIERAVAERADAQVSVRRAGAASARAAATRQMVLGIVSLVAAIPISIVLGVTGHFTAMLVAWIGIVGVNLAHAAQGRQHP